MTSQTSLSLLNLGQGVIVAVGLILVMWMAAAGVISGDNTIGDFVMVNTFLIQLYLPLNFLGVVYREIKRSLVDMDKMFELLEHKPDVVDAANAQELKVGPGQIDFENVFFGYSEERGILKNISFQVPPGKRSRLLGPVVLASQRFHDSCSVFMMSIRGESLSMGRISETSAN